MMPEPRSTRAKRLARRLLTLSLTAALFIGAGLGVYGGLQAISTQDDPTAAIRAPRTPVMVMQVQMDRGYDVTRRFIGQLEANARLDLGFELGGRVTQVLVGEGDVVAAGSVLAQLDTTALLPERAALEAELAALAADAELARLTLARNDALSERGFRSVAAQDDARLTLARIDAAMQATRARIAGVDVRLDKSVLRAPFDARIGARLVDPGQTVAAGQGALVLYDAGPARVRVGLPPDLAAHLTLGAGVQVDHLGQTYGATITQIRPDLDPATRSRAVILTLADDLPAILGDTIALRLTQRIDDPGFWVPLAALREGARGAWSVMAVEPTPDGDRIRPAAVEVLHTDGPRVYLRGALPPGARIVAEAPDRVAPGQLVLTQIASAAGE